MTDDELRAIEARANAATEGPWVEHDDCWESHGGHEMYQVRSSSFDVADSLYVFDAEFIAHARTDVPRLVAEVRRLREALECLECAAEDFYADQSKATDPRCGLVQPVTVAEANLLNDALRKARAALAGEEAQ